MKDEALPHCGSDGERRGRAADAAAGPVLARPNFFRTCLPPWDVVDRATERLNPPRFRAICTVAYRSPPAQDCLTSRRSLVRAQYRPLAKRLQVRGFLCSGDRLPVYRMAGMEASWKRLRAQRAWPCAARSAPGESAFGSPHETFFANLKGELVNRRSWRCGSSSNRLCSSTSRRSTTRQRRRSTLEMLSRSPTNTYNSLRSVVEINRSNNNDQHQQTRCQANWGRTRCRKRTLGRGVPTLASRAVRRFGPGSRRSPPTSA